MNQPTAITDIRRDLVALLPRLRRFALTMATSASEADDLVREVCAKAIQKSHHWKGEGRIESWLFSLMRGACADARKKRKAENSQESPEAGLCADPSREVNPVLSMPDGLASVFLLGEVEGFSYKEAAAILGITADLFASRLCVARLQLAALGVETAERRA